MIKDEKLLLEFEKEQLRKENLTLEEKYKILDVLYEEAVYMGILPSEDPLEGIEDKIRLAKILNELSISDRNNSKKTKET